MKIFLLMGIQGSGKGTQAQRIAKQLNIPHISTGDIFRATMKQDSPLGAELRTIVNNGDLVPDDLTSRMVQERIAQPDAQTGFILDGYPRTEAQATALDETLQARDAEITAVLFFNLPQEQAVARLSQRRVCSADSSHVYHLVHNPPQVDNVCDIDGAELIHRKDDQPEAIQKRVNDYINETMPLLERYRAQDKVREVQADQDMAAVTRQVLTIVEEQVAE